MKTNMTVRTISALALLVTLAAGAKATDPVGVEMEIADDGSTEAKAEFLDGGTADAEKMTELADDGLNSKNEPVKKVVTSEDKLVAIKKAQPWMDPCSGGGDYVETFKNYNYKPSEGKLELGDSSSAKLFVKVQWKKKAGHFKCIKDVKVEIAKKPGVDADSALIAEISEIKTQIAALTSKFEYVVDAGRRKQKAMTTLKFTKGGKSAKLTIDGKGEAKVEQSEKMASR